MVDHVEDGACGFLNDIIAGDAGADGFGGILRLVGKDLVDADPDIFPVSHLRRKGEPSTKKLFCKKLKKGVDGASK